MLGLHHEPRPPRQRALVFVLLVLDRRPYGPCAVHLLPDPNLLPVRVSEPVLLRDDPADPPGRTVLCAEVPCTVGDDVWTAPAAALAQRVADDLVRCGLPDPRPVSVHVERLRGVHVVPTAGALAAVARAERALTLSRRVTVLGRPGLDPVDDLAPALELGVSAARCAQDDGAVDPRAWHAELDRLHRARVAR